MLKNLSKQQKIVFWKNCVLNDHSFWGHLRQNFITQDSALQFLSQKKFGSPPYNFLRRSVDSHVTFKSWYLFWLNNIVELIHGLALLQS